MHSTHGTPAPCREPPPPKNPGAALPELLCPSPRLYSQMPEGSGLCTARRGTAEPSTSGRDEGCPLVSM